MTRFLAGESPRQEATAGRGGEEGSLRLSKLIYCDDEKRQIIHRLPLGFVRQTLADFNSGSIDAPEACRRLQVGKTRLYQLRSLWLKDRDGFQIKPSGGDQRGPWPKDAVLFLRTFVPLENPPNFQLIADELLRLYGMQRARSSVEAYIKTHLPQLIQAPNPKPRPYRRFRRANFGELWQHDSSIHQWWPDAQKQTLLLTVDDHSGFNVAGRFVPRDTTWDHFCHFREAFERIGLPQAIYTDALSLFGPSSSGDRRDPRSEFQRALKALEVAHLVAPSPQAKGKIERRFGTFQKRMVALLAHAKADSYEEANRILLMEIDRQNSKKHSATGEVPAEVFERSQARPNDFLRPCPNASLLDLHFSLRASRRVHNDHSIEFDGRSYQIAPTRKKYVTTLFHPASKLWVLEEPPKERWPTILGQFSL